MQDSCLTQLATGESNFDYQVLFEARAVGKLPVASYKETF